MAAKKNLKLLCLFILFFFHQAIAQESLSKKLNDIIAPFNKEASIGVIIQSMNNQKILFSKNSEQRFTPASVQKIYPAIAALSYLPKYFTYQTKVSSYKKNIYFTFSGDPTFTHDDLNNLISTIKSKGIKKISGNIVIDDSVFNNIATAPGWLADDLSYAFAAPVNAVIIDQNAFAIKIYPNKKTNNKPKLKSNLPMPFAQFNNQLKSTEKYNRKCPIAVYYLSNNHYLLSGCVAKQKKFWVRKLAIHNPIQYAKKLIKQDLKNNNIIFSGKLLTGKTPKKATLIAQHQSESLPELIKIMLKESNNMIADSLLKTLGATYFHQPGSWQNGIRAMRKILSNKADIQFKGMLLTDGAGLSRYNLLTPGQTAKLLNFAYQTPKIKQALLKALPIGGVDGTLKHRFIITPYQNNIMAKTGTMTGITSLAGYVKTNSGNTFSAVIFINDFVGSRKPYEALENTIFKTIFDFYQKTPT